MNRRICLCLLLWSTAWAAFAADPYPPAKFRRTQVVQPSDTSFVLEEWKAEEEDPIGGLGFLFQTWLVPKQGSPIRLMPVLLYDGLSSDSIGFESTYSFSPTSRYLFREQKVAHCQSGAYIYERKKGLVYYVLVPDLQKRAVGFFLNSTGVRFEYDCGMVWLVNWVSPDSLAIGLSGYAVIAPPRLRASSDRKFGISDWRCVFSIPSQSFSIPDEWLATNKAAIAER
jgi:hypothetical protein